MATGRGGKGDPTIWAIPIFFLTMAGEFLLHRRRASRNGSTPGTYERKDTATSLTMGTLSVVLPLLLPKVLRPITPGKGRFGAGFVGLTATAVAVTTIADRKAAQDRQRLPEGSHLTPHQPTPSERIASASGVAAVGMGLLAISTWWASVTSIDRLWSKRFLHLGRGPVAWLVALLGWDFIYYWNHRTMHERRFMWAIHVVHHSSERYNLSTALRQPVADALGTFVPYSALCLVGVTPELVLASRGINLLYQYWIHTELVGTLGAAEAVLNSPADHRVHHGVNPQYLDRNHGGILISWDKAFGTYEPEVETVRYGLTKNVNSFNPWTVITHAYQDLVKDLSTSRSWRERLSHLLLEPGWGDKQKALQEAASAA